MGFVHDPVISCSNSALIMSGCPHLVVVCISFTFFVDNDTNVFNCIICIVTVCLWIIVQILDCHWTWICCFHEWHCMCWSIMVFVWMNINVIVLSMVVPFLRKSSAVSFFLSLEGWSLRYCSAIVGIAFMYVLPYTQPSDHCYSYYVGSVIVTVLVFVIYGSISPWSPVFSLNHYSRPYRNRIMPLQSTIDLVSLVCLSTNAS